MIKRTLFFGNFVRLSTKDKQLIIEDKETGELTQTPVEDLGFVVFDNPTIVLTQNLLQEFAENNVAVVFCNKKHHPSSLLFHLDTNQIQTEIFALQINSKEPLKKQLWQQTIKAKIKNQAELLKSQNKNYEPLLYYSKKVKSGDTSNEEAKAARVYWKTLLGKEFIRDRDGDPPNSALNYGYAILRAAVARALSGSGLLPTLGIHHKNRYNSYCLADDIMEPYRPFVDLIVYNNKSELFENWELTKEIKAQLLSVLSMDVLINKNKSPLMVALSQSSSSLAKCLSGDSKKLKYPKFIK